ncbi:HAD hydrolase family protein [Prolixibacteraceae bacterium Z1-6]|uniref:HAD hydrolase family protein n=1 Tax=Draconibacterium aestuarii TaxID=2998507 RepID=A0A9X3FA47_9BACT|nr:HAD hydrolase family protein [Prolixibacteraceae bacterium Z1-6]
MIIAVDFDGTIVKHRYPSIGKEIPYAIKTLKLFQEKGHRVILWTYRSGKELDKAVNFCKKKGLTFYAINSNYEGEELDVTISRKIYADIYIDDRNILGIPKWETIYNLLIEGKSIKNSTESED